jgi:hypothetical protein
MALNAKEVSVAVTGAFSKVANDAVIASATSDISGPGTINYGYISDSGITVSTDRSTKKIEAFQNAATVRVTAGAASATYKLTLLQNTKEARELYFGSEEVNGHIAWNAAKMTRGHFVFDYLDSEYEGDGEGFLYGRHDIPRGQITEVGDLVFKNGEAIGFEVTVTAYPDENGVVAHVYTATGTVSGS